MIDVTAFMFAFLDDDTLTNIGLVCKQYNNAFNSYNLWYYKIKQLHDDLPLINIGISTKRYQELYFCLLYKKYSNIMYWADINNNLDIINWLLYKKFYIKWYCYYVGNLLNTHEKIINVKTTIISSNIIFMFILNNRYFLATQPKYRKEIYNRLLDFKGEKRYSDIADKFMHGIFDDKLNNYITKT